MPRSARKDMDFVERMNNTSPAEVIESIADTKDQIQSRVQDTVQDVRGRFEELQLSEATVPDAFRNVPKFISPSTHAMLDVGVIGYFAVVGGICALRGRMGAAIAAGMNAAMVAGVSLMTDYQGTGDGLINFKLHGTLDAMQAITAALGPLLHGFAGEPEAKYFYGQALNEFGVIAATDWDAGMRRRRRKAA